jgi:hypothetical protein
MRSTLLFAALLSGSLFACASAPPLPQVEPEPVAAKPAQAVAAPSSDAPPSQATSQLTPAPTPKATSVAAPAQGKPATGLRATAGMKLEGNVDADKLVAAINTQVADLQKCVAVIRSTDNVVGSLNLEVKIAQDGAVVTDLQSPVNDPAKMCLMDGFHKWTVKDAGVGKAMLMLAL